MLRDILLPLFSGDTLLMLVDHVFIKAFIIVCNRQTDTVNCFIFHVIDDKKVTDETEMKHKCLSQSLYNGANVSP